ncbi:M23 family metallopeptidase [Sphingomonas sp. IC-11]|uniref:M23 family metallopeptidase n=1 Tax=Sphingomonas sp. IC-11 TaxID=2898528 RepID=UPI001E356EAB|nr:M23 family metallopeptidase [Sphingomonas sp. IC-11]MCD2315790.1 M23 family metallopeptidase [Sphingomonas sp. IC-11]
MTKLGATILALIVLAVIGFASMLTFGPENTPRSATPNKAPAARTPEVANIPLSIPVAGITANQLTNTWGDTRGGGSRTHEAIDIMAPAHTPVLAAGPGSIEKLFYSKAGGTTLYVRSPDRRWSHYYAHLADYAPGVREGMTVTRGMLLGYVGDTGNAGPGNTHLHFGVSRMAPGDRWHQGTPVNPYPLLAGKRKVR